jgi:hypothetical protein
VKETLIYAGDGAVVSNQMIQKFADAVAGRSKRELEAALRLILGSVEVVINAKLNAAIDRLSDSTKAWPIRMGDLCPSFRTSSKNSGDFAASRPRTNVCLQGYPTGTDAPSIGKAASAPQLGSFLLSDSLVVTNQSPEPAAQPH